MSTRTILTCLFSMVVSTTAHSQGTSFLINDVDNKFIVAGGIADPNGYAPMVFADGSADAQLQHVNEPSGNVARTDQPGFIIESFAQHIDILVEFIARPVQGTDPVQERLLWHWSEATQAVSTIPDDLTLIVEAPFFGQAVLSQPGSPALDPLYTAHLLPQQFGMHLHLLNYILDDSPAAPTGAYGFFARFFGSFDQSDPFLVVFNNGLDENSLRTAALAINAAASDRVELAGDYNNNGIVDAADYVVWRNTLGSMTNTAADGNGDNKIDAADFGIWRSNFGRTSGSGSLIATVVVPEPGALALFAAGILGAFTARKRT